MVLIGGGSGNAAMLRGLKHHTSNITVIVSVMDDGGSSGRIRDSLDMIPPGDLRNCLVALAADDNEMASIMARRFDDGTIRNESLGNLLFVALYELTGDYLKTIETISYVLNVRGRVLPITTNTSRISGVLKNGNEVFGESHIAEEAVREGTSIDHIRLFPDDAPLLPQCRAAIREADIIIYSPGSLYTSLIPNLLVTELVDELEASPAERIFIANAMSEHGETDGFTVSGLIEAVEKHTGGRKIIDTVIYNTASVPEEILSRYAAEEAAPVGNAFTPEHIQRYRFIGSDVISLDGGIVRHDADRIWDILDKLEKENI